MKINHFKLLDVPRPPVFMKRLSEAEEVTGSYVGIITRAAWKGDVLIRKLEAVSLWFKPHLFVIDLK